MAKVITIKNLKVRCEGTRFSILNRGLASERELDEIRPGGVRNPGTTVWEWLHYDELLHRIMEREQIAAGKSVRPDQKKTAASNGHGIDPEAERVLLDLQREAPEHVELIAPLTTEDGSIITSLPVYGKSVHALIELQGWDWQCAWISTHLEVLMDLNRAEDVQLIQDCNRRLSYLYGVMTWMLTSGDALSTAACPYSDAQSDRPQPPAHYRHLQSLDLIRIYQAHLKVNQLRLHVLYELIPALSPDKKAQRAGWSEFIVQVASDTGMDDRALMRQWSRGAVIARAVLHAKAERERAAAAKDASEKERKTA